MSITIDTSTQFISQIASRLDSSNVQHRQYLNNLNFAQQVQAHGGQDSASKSQGVSALVKPSSGVFAEMAGIDEDVAVSILHGVVGSNIDTRDWGAIMASDDPLTAARQATAAMYGTPPGEGVVQTTNPATGQPRLQSGNFAMDRVPVDSTVSSYGQGESAVPVARETQPALFLVDREGTVLRNAGDSAAQVTRNAWLFGFDTAPLRELASALQGTAPQLAAQLNEASDVVLSRQGPPAPKPGYASGSGSTAPPVGEVAVPTPNPSTLNSGLTSSSADELTRLLRNWVEALKA